MQTLILKPKTWPLFRPIPLEHHLHVNTVLIHELFWNGRLGLIGLFLSIPLYYYLLSEEVQPDRYSVWIWLQGLSGLAGLILFSLAEKIVKSIKLRKLLAASLPLIVGALLGYGFLVQIPLIHDPYRIVAAYTLIVGVTGASAFAFTTSPNIFLVFSIPFMMPTMVWLWLNTPGDAGALLSLMALNFLGVLYFLTLREYRRRVNLILTELNLKKEQERSQALLLNILPQDIAEELKLRGKAEPTDYAQVTVLFTDFVGFTRISEKLSPRELIDELDRCFSYFDQVTEKYRLEKLKTIGDSFMCAGGLPTTNKTHAIDCCLAALEIQAFMNQMKDIKHQQGFDYWELRLGMSTGPLIAGVVGHKKFAFDVWGDTVNTASRMESSGTAGFINISSSTYEKIKYLFRCEYRGKVKAKNKGEIDMYYLIGIRPKYSVNGEGRVPNRDFLQYYEAIGNGKKLKFKREIQA